MSEKSISFFNENTIDGKSRNIAYTLWESDLVADKDVGKVKALQQIHAYIFGGLYDFAGKIRTKTISKGNTIFCLAEYLHQNLKTIEQMPETTFDEIVDKYVEMNVAHPFREGNGRSGRIWLDHMLRSNLHVTVDWSAIEREDYLLAMERSPVRDTEIKALLRHALSYSLDSIDLIACGIDASYAFEGFATYHTEGLISN